MTKTIMIKTKVKETKEEALDKIIAMNAKETSEEETIIKTHETLQEKYEINEIKNEVARKLQMKKYRNDYQAIKKICKKKNEEKENENELLRNKNEKVQKN